MIKYIYMLINFLKPIVIVGIMGSGKTQFAKKLSKKIKLNSIDLDHEITNEKGSVKHLINTLGMEEYQKIEFDALKKFMQKDQDNKCYIISTGDTIVLNHVAMNYIYRHATSVWINPSLQIIYNRLKISDNRPFLTEDLSFEDFKKMFLKRKKVYQKSNLEIKNIHY